MYFSFTPSFTCGTNTNIYELLDTQADESPSEQGLFAEGVDDVDEDNDVLPASSENADDDGDDDKVSDLKRLKWKLDFLHVELLCVA